MKKRALCELAGLKGVKRRKVDGFVIKESDESYIKEVLERKDACIAVGENGSLNIWKTDAGVIRGEMMRNWCTLEEKTFADYSEVAHWAAKWIDYINAVIPLPSDDDSTPTPVQNPAFKRDVDRIIRKSRDNILDAFCDATCGKREDYDGHGNPCPQNTCPIFNDFIRRSKLKAIRGLETQEAKEIVAQYTNEQ